MSGALIPAELRRRCVERDRRRCAYCCTSQRIIGPVLEVDHIRPRARGGRTEISNLCLACPMCNGHKADRTSATDPESGHVVRLYHPRRDRWTEHFAWTDGGAVVQGVTEIGRATVTALQMNHPEVVTTRRLWVSVGWHPPAD